MRMIKLDPARRIGVTSDTHYSHANIIAFCLRPFLSDEERRWVVMSEKDRVAAGGPARVELSAETVRRQNDALVDGINAVLGADDVLIHAGDVAWDNPGALAEFRSRLTVREIYVAVGNHDDEDELAAVFGRDRVFERFAVKVGPQEAVIDHYPGDSWQASHKRAFQLFGHVHGAANARRRQNPAWALSIDVGVDSHGFKPWLWTEELLPLFAERRAAFDLWAARAYPGKEAGGMAPVGPV